MIVAPAMLIKKDDQHDFVAIRTVTDRAIYVSEKLFSPADIMWRMIVVWLLHAQKFSIESRLHKRIGREFFGGRIGCGTAQRLEIRIIANVSTISPQIRQLPISE